MLSAIVGVADFSHGEFFFYFVDKSGKPAREYLAVIDGNVSYSVIEIVARREHVMRHRRKRFGGHIRRREFAGRLAFPVFIDLVKSFLCFVGYVKRICGARGDGIEFLFEPLERIFGENLTRTRMNRRRTDDKFAVAYRYRDVFEYVLKRLCPADDYRLAFGRLIRLGDKHRPVGFYLRHFSVKRVFQKIYSVGFGYFARIILRHNYLRFIVPGHKNPFYDFIIYQSRGIVNSFILFFVVFSRKIQKDNSQTL